MDDTNSVYKEMFFLKKMSKFGYWSRRVVQKETLMMIYLLKVNL